MTGQPPGETAAQGGGLGEAPPAAQTLFGARLPAAVAFAELLAGAGVERGLIGPREVPRLWGRHLLNCAVLGDELPARATALDVGSGAGLPGIVLALRRPDLRVTLLEPMQRRVAFLDEAVTTLALGETVSVVRGRAEDRDVRRTLGQQAWIVARAVAPLDRLASWCVPLLAEDGRLLALKGASGATEAAAARPAVERAGGRIVGVRELAPIDGVDPTWVVEVRRGVSRGPAGARRRGR